MKVGDNVKCVWAGNSSGMLTVGKIYQINFIDEIGIGIIGDNGKEISCYRNNSTVAKFETLTEKKPEPIDKGEKYQREISPGVFVDIYDVLDAWGVSCPARQHAIKKLLAAGQRGHKSEIKDLQEADHSVHRAIMFQIERERKGNGQSLSDNIAD